jgi:hypothetical protein
MFTLLERSRKMRITKNNFMKLKDVSEETAIECMEVLKSTSDELHDKYPDLFRQFYNKPTGYYTKLVVLDKLLSTYGIESFEHKKAAYTYLNAGDSYCLTVIYNHRKGNFTLNSWGDIVEK